jgi:Major tropism determinant N-terminal domain
MPIKQISKVLVRSGLQQNLPQLAKGELGWAVDTQRLFIGNGNVSDGAPFAGNTEIITVVSDALLPVQVPFILPTVIYSAAGIPLPPPSASLNGATAIVSDATAPTYLGAYTSGGSITCQVICSFNGSSYSWKTN